MNATLKQYLPTIGSVIVVVLTVLAGALTDDRVTMPELVVIVMATLTALMTYVVPRTTQWPWLKIAVTATLAAVNALQGYMTDGLTSGELTLVLVAGIGALGVVAASSKYAPLHAGPGEETSAPGTMGAAANASHTYGTDVKQVRS